jgi:hypothetical protein
MKHIPKTFWQIVLLLALVIPSWVTNIDRVINIDEPRWMVRGANFYYAITSGDFENTFYEYHPGITNQWIVAAALHLYFPEYRGMGQGYFDPLKPRFEEFLREQNREALVLARYSRYLQAGVIAVLTVLAFLLLRLLIPETSALLGMALAVISPFYLGHSRLLNLEGMLALFVLVSLLSILVYVRVERKWLYLLVSGAAFGLAQLSKSSSIVVLGVVGLVLFVDMFNRGSDSFWKRVGFAARAFGIWFLAAVIVYFVLWPGMWVAPGKMLAGVYGNAVSYAFQGARLDVTEQLQPSNFGTELDAQGTFDFLKAWASSTTPLTWGGLALLLTGLLSPVQGRSLNRETNTSAYLFLLGMLFILMFGLAKGRDSQHYVLSSYVAFDLLSGIGWGFALLWIGQRWNWLSRSYVPYVFCVVLTFAQISIGLPYAPYYFNYKNPLAAEAATYGYGEGMDQAAAYLVQKPNAENMRVYVYGGMGTFSYFFPGETLVLKRAYLINYEPLTLRNEIRKSEYLVLYPVTREKHPESQLLFEVLKDVSPEKVIIVDGIEYIYIYRVAEIPESVYEAFGE